MRPPHAVNYSCEGWAPGCELDAEKEVAGGTNIACRLAVFASTPDQRGLNGNGRGAGWGCSHVVAREHSPAAAATPAARKKQLAARRAPGGHVFSLHQPARVGALTHASACGPTHTFALNDVNSLNGRLSLRLCPLCCAVGRTTTANFWCTLS